MNLEKNILAKIETKVEINRFMKMFILEWKMIFKGEPFKAFG